jgi:hypothetical protein
MQRPPNQFGTAPFVPCPRGKKEGIFDLAALVPAIHTSEKFRKKNGLTEGVLLGSGKPFESGPHAIFVRFQGSIAALGLAMELSAQPSWPFTGNPAVKVGASKPVWYITLSASAGPTAAMTGQRLLQELIFSYWLFGFPPSLISENPIPQCHRACHGQQPAGCRP